ncbi:hypothetical protein TSAR_002174 [Trichomalopsis sarcophagae]|uniref:NR LBD domain-containing protein n=1 Tax=Trichomalopsis sarcophagae TaxID=543379 RepID=A0A232EN74_9HYME|nr:hypothetical protein TSAR_002174 [Trichomalopsis sarcophagae]
MSLPFFCEVPKLVHTDIVLQKRSEILLFTTLAYRTIRGQRQVSSFDNDDMNVDFDQEVLNKLHRVQASLNSLTNRNVAIEFLREQLVYMIEKICYITIMFRRLQLRTEEYVCLKIIAILSPLPDVKNIEHIRERYVFGLRSFVENSARQITRNTINDIFTIEE